MVISGLTAPIGGEVSKVVTSIPNMQRARAIASTPESHLPPLPVPPPPPPVTPPVRDITTAAEWNKEARPIARDVMADAAAAGRYKHVVPAEIQNALREQNLRAVTPFVQPRLTNTIEELKELERTSGRKATPTDVYNMKATRKGARGKPLLGVTAPALGAGLEKGLQGETEGSPGGKSGGTSPRRSSADEESYIGPSEPPPFRRGGIIGRALSIAKKYAAGGAVHEGPIVQVADGGRTDTYPADVRSGAYVIPADVISGLGEGDTGNGYRVATHMFGPHSPSHAHPGEKTVPIVAAGGEFVVSPAAVARVGRGDMAAGHDALDHWVKMERRKTIQKLKRLPGPQRD
jgi:hypothetical protein